MTAGEALAAAADYLGARGVDTPRLDAELILAATLGLSRIELRTDRARPLSDEEHDRARGLLARRGAREPLAYVLGEWGFRRLLLRTDARALVPRPETEVVVERALALVAHLPAPRVVDVGTGSGAIALAIATEHPGARVTATDLSAAALELAAENARALGVELALVHTNLLDGVGGPFDLVVANPPYVRADEIDELEPEVRDWEPRLALVGEEEETDALARAARTCLVCGGAIVLESHERGALALAGRLAAVGYLDVAVTRDLAGRDRVVEGRWPRGT